MGPGHPFGFDVPGFYEFSIQVPHRGVGHDPFGGNLLAVGKTNAVGLTLVDEDLIHQAAVEDPATVFFDDLFQFV